MAAPAIPSNLSVYQANNQVSLTWSQVSGATSYKVQRSTDNVTFSLIASPTTFNYLDTTVTQGTMYFYRVASDNGTTSSYTNSQAIVPCVSGTMSLMELRLRAQQRADRVNSNFVTKEEWNSYINQSYYELYDLLIQKYGNDYFVAAPLQFTTTSAQLYDLPNGVNYSAAKPIYKLLGVDLNVGGAPNGWITLKKFEFLNRNNYLYPQITTNLLGIAGLRYRLVGSQIEFIPFPQPGQQIQLWYIPRLTELIEDTSIAEGISGWLEYVIVDAAIKALQKEESDISGLMAQKMALIDRIEAAAENRDAGQPEVLINPRKVFDAWGYGNGFGGPFGGY